MSDLLILASRPDDLAQLEQLAARHSLDFKSAIDVTTALEWLSRRRFSLAIIDSEIDIPSQQKLADALWRMDGSASYYVFNLHATQERKRQELRLFGAEAALGADALKVLEQAMKSLTGGPPGDPDKFAIMVVEDLDSPRDVICFYLESMGYKSVTGVRSARDAMAKLEADPGKYSCLITDLKMPEIPGTELIAHVRSHPKLNHLPVIVLTAYGSADMLVECLNAGASGFLVKPPRKSDLTRELNRAHRIVRGEINPRLARGNEIETIREVLIDKGLT